MGSHLNFAYRAMANFDLLLFLRYFHQRHGLCFCLQTKVITCLDPNLQLLLHVFPQFLVSREQTNLVYRGRPGQLESKYTVGLVASTMILIHLYG